MAWREVAVASFYTMRMGAEEVEEVEEEEEADAADAASGEFAG